MRKHTSVASWVTRGDKVLAVNYASLDRAFESSLVWREILRALFSIAVFDYVLFALLDIDLLTFVLSLL